MSAEHEGSQEDWPARARSLLRRLQPDLVLESPVPATQPIVVVGAPGSGKTELIAALAEEAPDVAVREVNEADLAAFALIGAKAALVVLDAAAPVDATDLAVVRAVAGRVHHIVFAITKIDAYEDWRGTRAKAADALEDLGPRFASAVLHPVSARLHHLAMNAHDPLQVRQWSAASGVRELAADLSRIEKLDPELLTRQNWLRYVDAQLSEAGMRSQDPAEEEALSQKHRQVLRERTHEHRNLDAGRAERRDMLRNQLQLARVDLAVELNSLARSTSAQARDFVSKASGRQLKNLVEVVKPKILELDQRMVGLSQERIAAISSAVLGRADLRSIALLSQPALHPPEHLDPPKFGAWGMDDFIMVILGASAGFGLGRIAVVPFQHAPGISALSMPLAAAVGLAIAIAIVSVRRLSSGRQKAVAWVSEAVSYRRGQLEQTITAGLLHAETELTQVLDDLFLRQRIRSESRVDELEQQAKDIATQLTQLRTRRERVRSEIFTVRKGLVALANAADQH
ncbi:hypothetical protein Srot_2831 [Segniliparus rotundus DSM 44985]|uniref:G domain-containing protein n=1 Tax=Segniliparus rotundus (strain ATCC BAA-972 / CDC 1076 / CIP 108378 / DSM 44985 / JCM 13578) TaxID=640132 RepID=D6ZDK5_SEGRD|nr:hypothetical protein [Segniliparus rotundus]ADG99262.1 hypothetical protein Srot_2831 [Segniliparus rotundus DSM 44985]